MMKIYQTSDKRLTRVGEIAEGTWISLTAPSPEEVRQVAATLDIEPADLQAALDPEESARVSLEDGYTVIIVDVPVQVPDKGVGVYTTIPLGILLTQQTITTVCAVDSQVLQDFAACRVREFSTRKKMRFVYQIMNRAATMYQQELRLIDGAGRRSKRTSPVPCGTVTLLNCTLWNPPWSTLPPVCGPTAPFWTA